MYRYALTEMQRWRERPNRKPLVIRGARQVGKTTLVRLFAEEHFANLVELNLERNPELADLFAGNHPQTILQRLELHQEQEIRAGYTLLFLDEIQAAPQVLATLRYFYEELPELHVVAAGSLLEMALEQPAFSVPVGRIEYLHLGPMQLGEMLLAAGRPRLERLLRHYHLGDELPAATHNELLKWLRIFTTVGGMPESVSAYVRSGTFTESEIVKHSILSTFRDDFGKYCRRIDPTRLRKVFERLPHLVGNKLKYVHIDRDERAKDLAAALHCLLLAQVASQVRHTSANAVPLGAEAHERRRKVVFLDVGLMATAMGLSILDLERADDIMLAGQGKLCEQLVGQQLLSSIASWRSRTSTTGRGRKGVLRPRSTMLSHRGARSSRSRSRQARPVP
jgi:predicted AAA+ superfamily ATPase